MLKKIRNNALLRNSQLIPVWALPENPRQTITGYQTKKLQTARKSCSLTPQSRR